MAMYASLGITYCIFHVSKSGLYHPVPAALYINIENQWYRQHRYLDTVKVVNIAREEH